MQIILNEEDISKIKDVLEITKKYMNKCRHSEDQHEVYEDELKIYSVRDMLPYV